MPRAPKEASKGNSVKPVRAEEKAEPAAGDAPQSARAELMRAQRDLESVRLELVEQKRKSSQHALVHAEELKEARASRDQLRMQIDALRAEQAAPVKKKRREEDERVATLEEELDKVRAELKEARSRSPRPPADSERWLFAAIAKLQEEHAQVSAELGRARSELAARQPAPPHATPSVDSPAPVRIEAPVPAPAAQPEGPITSAAGNSVPVAPAVPESAPPGPPAQRSFFSKLFGRRTPA